MPETITINQELLNRYVNNGPRYTSYPTVKQFHNGFDEYHYRSIAKKTNEDLIPKPLSLYIHVPFCEKVCFYCACNKIITANRAHASKYLEYLVKEIALQAKLFDRDRKIEQLHFGGGTPTYIESTDLRNLLKTLSAYFNFRNDDKGDYSIEIDPRQMGRYSLEELRELGFNRISIGVQDFDETVQKAVNRIQPLEQTLAIIDSAKNNQFKSINIDLIYGLPNQTLNSFSETLDRIIDLDPDRIAMYSYAHLPQLFKTQKQIDENQLPSAQVRLDILNDAIQKLSKHGYAYIGMDHFAKNSDSLFLAQQAGTLHRNFQGYTTNIECDSLGLGISAISKLGESYSQNYSTLDQYYYALDQEKLPIRHGYKLDLDDCLRRHIIMSLICHFELLIETVETQYHIDFFDYFYNEIIKLTKMQNDGLVKIDSESIQITPLGRFLIRNICTVFDKHNPSNRQSREAFSQQI